MAMDEELRKDVREMHRELMTEIRELKNELFEVSLKQSRLEGRYEEFRDRVIDQLSILISDKDSHQV